MDELSEADYGVALRRIRTKLAAGAASAAHTIANAADRAADDADAAGVELGLMTESGGSLLQLGARTRGLGGAIGDAIMTFVNLIMVFVKCAPSPLTYPTSDAISRNLLEVTTTRAQHNPAHPGAIRRHPQD